MTFRYELFFYGLALGIGVGALIATSWKTVAAAVAIALLFSSVLFAGLWFGDVIAPVTPLRYPDAVYRSMPR